MLSPEEQAKVQEALHLIEAAQSTILSAQHALCPLEGFGDLWTATSRVHDTIKKHWHRVNDRAGSLRRNANRSPQPLFVA